MAQFAVALARAGRLLAEHDPEGSLAYLRRAARAFEWLRTAQPHSAEGYSHASHGVPAGFAKPDEWMTRDLLMMMWAAFELARGGLPAFKSDALSLARRILRRQVPQEQSEGGLYGHFYTFDSAPYTEKAFVHHHTWHDMGGTWPHYLVPLMEMCHYWRPHPDAQLWRQALRNFAYGYLQPACRQNPFHLLPQGCYPDEGLLVFGSIYHGINEAYAASLALEFEQFLGDPAFLEIAVGNLQWIAGLNSGLTADMLAPSSHMYRPEIASGTLVPISMIYGLGRQSGGSWTHLRGAICDGFSISEQFTFNTRAARATDGPWQFCDEDRIIPIGAWASAMARLRRRAWRQTRHGEHLPVRSRKQEQEE